MQWVVYVHMIVAYLGSSLRRANSPKLAPVLSRIASVSIYIVLFN